MAPFVGGPDNTVEHLGGRCAVLQPFRVRRGRFKKAKQAGMPRAG